MMAMSSQMEIIMQVLPKCEVKVKTKYNIKKSNFDWQFLNKRCIERCFMHRYNNNNNNNNNKYIYSFVMLQYSPISFF